MKSKFLPVKSKFVIRLIVGANQIFHLLGAFSLRLTAMLTGLALILSGIPSTYADQNPPGCTGSGLGILLYTDASDVHVGNTLHYSVTIFNGTTTGPIVCDATSITAFLVTPDGVSHQIPLTVTNLVSGQSDFYPDVVSYTVRAQDIQPDGTVDATASDSGIIHQNTIDSQGGGHQGVNTVVSMPCLQIAAQCSSGIGEAGVITFSGTVTNCGNDDLYGVGITNMVNGTLVQVAYLPTLATNQSASFSGSWTPASPCSPNTAVLTATGTDSETSYPTNVMVSTTLTCSDVLTPAITVTKTCPVSGGVPGQLLVYSGTVSNAGNVTLTGVVVVDNQPSPNTQVYSVASLAPGASANFTGSFLAPTNCSASDTLTATGTSTCGVVVNSTFGATCPIVTTPQLLVTVACPGTPVGPGGSLTYSGTVQNTGNIGLTNVLVYSDTPVANTKVFAAATLAPGVSTNFTGTYTVPANTCSVTTTLTGTGYGSCGLLAVTNVASTTCSVTTTPGITVSLACPSTSATGGGLITYSGTVHNSGNVILNNVFVVNNQPAPNTPVIGPITLPVGASSNFTASFTAPLGSCSVSSMVTATGNDNCTSLPVSNTAQTTCSLITSPGIAISEDCPTVPAVPGGLLVYSGTVTNTGNVTLTNVSILNNLSGITPVLSLVSLAPGATANFSGSYLAPTNCFSASTSTVTGRSICGVAVSGSTTLNCPVNTSPALNVTETCPVNPTIPGAVLTYSGTLTNAGNITLTNIVVLNSVNGNTPIFRSAILPPGAGVSFTASYLTPTNCSSTSTLTASAESSCGLTITNTASATCAIITAPQLKVTQTCPVGPVAPGGLLTYSGTVTNTGNITITNIVVVNDQSGVIFTAATLAPGVGAGYTGSYLAPFACSSTSTSTATGASVCGVAVSAAASTTCAITTTPQITINQSCPQVPAIPGGLINFSGSISNAGNIMLTNVTILNNLSGSTPVFTVATLAPGVIANFTGSYLAPTNCSSTSSSTVTARSICGIAVSSTATATCPVDTTPALNVTVNCPVNPTAPGALLVYSGTLTNTGNITLTNVVVFNDLGGASPVFNLAALAPGAGASFTGSYLTPTNCSTTSLLTVSGISTCGQAITNSAAVTCPIITTPQLKVTQNCPATPATPGSLLTYSGTVTNTGNIGINGVVVFNNMSGSLPILTIGALAPGAGASFTGSYLAPSDCSVTSVSTAIGVSACGISITNSAASTCPIVTTPELVVTEACPVNPAVPGGLLTYSGSVSNAGNIMITNVVVLNNLGGSTPVFTAAAMAPGAVTNFTGSYLAPTNCSSTSVSTVTGESICGIPVTNSASATCPIVTAPAIIVTENCPSVPVPVGGILTYSGSVSNAGNITLTNVVVVSDRPADNTTIFTVALLAPGATANFAGSYQVPLNCCVVFSTAQASGQGCSGVTVNDSYTSTCVVQTQPSIVVTKVCPTGLLRPGDLLTYSGSVSNSGDITLVNVSLTDSQAPNNPPLPAPIDLAPGQSVSYSGSYVIPPDFCGTDLMQARAQDVCTYNQVTAGVTTTCPVTTSPQIKVVKNCPAAPTPRGGLFTYTGTVSNAGDESLMNVYVTDDEPTNHTPVVGPLTLPPGASVNFTNSYVAPTCCCLIIDTLTAAGVGHCSASNVIATATAVCPLLTTPSLAVVENCPATPIPMGGTFNYSGYVTNTGDVLLTNVLVLGPSGSNNLIVGPISLAPGQAAPYSGIFTAGFNTSAVTITASGQETCAGTMAITNASCAVVPTPHIDPQNNLCPISFPTAKGETYVLQYNNCLTDTNWISLQSVAGTGSVVTLTDTNAAGIPIRFYRIMVTP